MTCIVGLEHNGEVFIGADSAEALGWEVKATSTPKAFRVGEFIIGYTTSFRMGQLLHYKLTVPKQENGADEKFLVCTFIETIRATLKEGGYTTIKDSTENIGVFLVGYRGKLYFVGSDYAITRPSQGIDACGCGREYALGAIEATPNLPPRQRIRVSLKAAAKYSAGVSPPFRVLRN